MTLPTPRALPPLLLALLCGAALAAPPTLELVPTAPRAGDSVLVIVPAALFGAADTGVLELTSAADPGAPPLRAEVTRARPVAELPLPPAPGRFELRFGPPGGPPAARATFETRPALPDPLGDRPPSRAPPAPQEEPPDGCPDPPDRDGLEAAFDAGVARLERAARRLYGGRFEDPEIEVRLQLPRELEPEVRLEARVEATATDVASGERVRGEGTVRADLAWRDCRWTLESIDVDY